MTSADYLDRLKPSITKLNVLKDRLGDPQAIANLEAINAIIDKPVTGTKAAIASFLRNGSVAMQLATLTNRHALACTVGIMIGVAITGRSIHHADPLTPPEVEVLDTLLDTLDKAIPVLELSIA